MKGFVPWTMQERFCVYGVRFQKRRVWGEYDDGPWIRYRVTTVLLKDKRGSEQYQLMNSLMEWLISALGLR